MRLPRGRSLLRGALAAVAARAVAPVAADVWRRHRRLSSVAADLRTPMLHLPLEIGNAATLTLARTLFGAPTTVVDGVDVERVGADDPAGTGSSVDVLVYRPAAQVPARVPALLWVHGGGTILGTPEHENDLCSVLAAELGMVVASVDYRLAPEHPFPAGLDDCHLALRWLHARADHLGVDPARIAVGGASAGGGLAAALAQRSHDAADVPVRFQALVYPMLDDRTVLRADDGTGVFVWTRTSNRYAWTSYLAHPPGEVEARQYAAPARRTDLTGLPPAWIGVGELDLFHAEDRDYAHRLRRAGVACTLRTEPGMYHAADVFASSAGSMRRFRADLVTALRDGLGLAR